MNMQQNLPDVPLAPAPWKLKGSGYMVVVRLPKSFHRQQSFIPAELQNSRRGSLVYMLFVHYQDSAVGPYHELLYVPGTFRFTAGRFASISRIFVSTWESVVNGRINWGIPKDRCDFEVQYGSKRDEVRLRTEDGTVIAELGFRSHLIRLPVTTRILPRKMHTLAQRWEGRDYLYTPESRGHIKPARLLNAYFNPDFLPDLNHGKIISCIRITDFSMVFPEARIIATGG